MTKIIPIDYYKFDNANKCSLLGGAFMIRKDLLKGWMSQSHVNLTQIAACLGMTTRTLYNRMKKGDFHADEMEKLIKTLHITNPSEVFFNVKEP